MISRNFAILSIALAIAALGSPSPLRADATPQQKLVDTVSPSIVTVRIVIKMNVNTGGSQSQELRMPTEGAVVTPDGLIMMSNVPVSSDAWKQLVGGRAADADVTITPTEFKVTIGREDKQYNAFLAATDPKLGLAFIKIEDLADRTLTPVVFTSGAAVSIGDEVSSVTRLSKGYDFAPVVQTARVAGSVSKPRNAWVVGSDIVGVGLPVFSSTGDAVGVMSFIATALSQGESDGSGMMMRYFDGPITQRNGIFMIPATAVATVVAEAAKQAVTVAAQRAAKSATPAPAAPAPNTTPAAPAKPTN